MRFEATIGGVVIGPKKLGVGTSCLCRWRYYTPLWGEIQHQRQVEAWVPREHGSVLKLNVHFHPRALSSLVRQASASGLSSGWQDSRHFLRGPSPDSP